MITAAEMKMDSYEARKAFLDYRAAVRLRHNDDDEALMHAYAAIAKHRRVIDLAQTMKAAGVDERGRPKLAICRADAEIVFCEVYIPGSARFAMRSSYPRQRQRVELPIGTFPRREHVSCRARVPMIPPRYRPRETTLEKYHLLWEAEWINAPKDPLLLRHLGKFFYAVVAQWDLTPLEQAILGAKGPA